MDIDNILNFQYTMPKSLQLPPKKSFNEEIILDKQYIPKTIPTAIELKKMIPTKNPFDVKYVDNKINKSKQKEEKYVYYIQQLQGVIIAARTQINQLTSQIDSFRKIIKLMEKK